jgi:alpha-L-fucosidase
MQFPIIKIKKMKRILFTVILLAGITSVHSQAIDQIAQEWRKMHHSKSQALNRFNEAKFGMFIHWGAYSQPAGIWKGEKIKGLGEWIFYEAQISRADYRQMCSLFNPVNFNAETWVKLAKDAGMKYIVAMPKHHDGFALYDSKVTEYDIMDATGFGRDPMEELYRACQKYGIIFSIYYSQATDWMDGGDAGVADYMKDHGEMNASDPAPVMEYMDSDQLWPSNTWDPAPVKFKEYLEKKSKPQMIELLTRFPGLQEIWYDVPQRMTREQSFEFYKLAFDYQPLCLINSRVGNELGDFIVPGDNEIPEGKASGGVYWETPGTLNDTWGYKSYDTHWKSAEEVLFWIAEIASKGGNYLLNVGPDGSGIIPEESVKILKGVGAWMKVNGEAVYGTHSWTIRREGPTNFDMRGRDEDGNIKSGSTGNSKISFSFTPEDYWFTEKNNFVYAISLTSNLQKKVSIKSLFGIRNQIKSIGLLGCEESLPWKTEGDKVVISLPVEKCTDIHGFALKIERKD